MKYLRFSLVAMALAVAATVVSAQDARERKYREDAYAEIMADPMKAGGGYYVREFGDGPLTPAPKGYKPVYISYYSRHGARYASGSDPYETVHKVLEKAHSEGQLTAMGEDFRSYFERVFEDADGKDGDLSPLGFKHVRGTARTMYRRFPGVFKGKTKAVALATRVPRVMLTMNSFMDELKTFDTDLETDMNASEKYVDRLIPYDGTRRYLIRKSSQTPEAEAAQKAYYTKVDNDAPLARLFKDLSWLEGQEFSKNDAERCLWKVCAAAQCLEDKAGMDWFTTIWPPEEYFAKWEADNIGFYYYWGHCPVTEHRGTLGAVDIVQQAIIDTDSDLAALDTPERVSLRLKFSHDTGIAPLLAFLKLNGMGAVINDPAEIKNYFQDYKVAMGSNFQFIFYRSKRNPEILFRVLYNGDEASLPLPEVAKGFYRWNDFKAYYGPLVEEGQKKLKEIGEKQQRKP